MSLRTNLDAAILKFQQQDTYDPTAIATLATAIIAYAESVPASQLVAGDIVALTDSSTGTSSGNTIAAVTDAASAANAIATLAAKVNAILTSLKTAGLMA